ncbi:MAG: GAP family protein [Synechococcaceae cyanobacterium]|nr:GAP family protein [Synechococcaceae cyanobacterium]
MGADRGVPPPRSEWRVSSVQTLDLPHLLAELLSFALAIAFSPLHIALLLLLLLGPDPLRRGGWFVAAWIAVAAVEMAVLLSVGHGLLLSMAKGSDHRTGLDLLAAGGLLGLGLNSLVGRGERGQATGPAWSARLDGFSSMALLPLVGLSVAIQVFSPDDLFLAFKAAATLLEAHLARSLEVLITGAFSLATAAFLLLPLLGVLLLGPQRVQPLLQAGKAWLYRRADGLVGVISLGLAVYFGWQGVEGLRLS